MFLKIEITYKDGSKKFDKYHAKDFPRHEVSTPDEFLERAKDQAAFEYFAPNVRKIDYYPLNCEEIPGL